jgi:thiol-disulfide isomerase/thioredoxin
MARTPSHMVPLGTAAAPFSLPDIDDEIVSLSNCEGEPLLVMFICNHCPFVRHIRAGLSAFAYEYTRKGLSIVAINSNDVETYPDDSPAMMKKEASEAGYVFPYLFDESQDVAKAYGAACTPDFFLFDRDHRLAYRGQFDDSRPGNDVPVTGSSLRAAVDAVLSGRDVPGEQRPSVGCNIKWKQG